MAANFKNCMQKVWPPIYGGKKRRAADPMENFISNSCYSHKGAAGNFNFIKYYFCKGAAGYIIFDDNGTVGCDLPLT